jgi:hypothetical protein
MNAVKGLMVGVALFFSLSSQAAENFDGVPDRVLAQIAQKDVRGAFTLLYTENKNEGKDTPPSDEAAMDSLVKMTEGQWDNLGAYVDSDLYKTEYFGSRYVLLTYIVNFANKPLVVNIKLYKPGEVWRPRGITWNGGMDDYIDQVHGVSKKKG